MKTERPQFELARIYTDGTVEPPEIVPVTRMPWDTQMNRRGVLGVGIGAAAALFLIDPPAEAVAQANQPKTDQPQPDQALKAPEPLIWAHAGEVRILALAPDGKTVISGSQDNTVKIWSFPEGNLLATLPAHVDDVNGLAIAPDGRTLVTIAADTLRLWSIPDGRLMSMMDGHTDTIRAVAIAPDGKWMVTGGDDKTIRFWSFPDGKLLKIVEGQDEPVKSLVIAPNGKVVAARGQERGLKFWLAPEGRLLMTLGRYSSNVCAIAPDSQTVAIGSYNIEIRSLSDGRLLTTFEPRENVVDHFFSRDGKFLISRQRDGISIRSLPDGKPLRKLTDEVLITLADDDKWLLTRLDYKTVHVRSLADERKVIKLQPNQSVSTALFAGEGRYLLTAQGQGIMALWDLHQPGFVKYFSDPAFNVGKSPDKKIKAHMNGVTALAVTQDGKILASCSNAGFNQTANPAKLWSLTDGRLLATLDGHKEGINDICIAPDGKTVITAGDDKTIKVWALPESAPTPAKPTNKKAAPKSAKNAPGPIVPKGRLLATLEGHAEMVQQLLLSADGKTLVSSDRRQATKVWSLPEGRLLTTLTEYQKDLEAIVMTPDGKLLATMTGEAKDQTVKLWALPEGRLLMKLEGHERDLKALALSPDGKLLATSADDRTIRLWELPGGQLIGTLESSAQSLAFSPDGTRLASSGPDESIKIWSLREWCLLTSLEENHQGTRRVGKVSLLFAPSGQWLISATIDGSIRLWEVPEGRLLATFDGERPADDGLLITPDSKTLVCGDSLGTIALWDLEKPGFRSFLFDAAANTSEIKGSTYNIYDQVTGRTITYTLPCGSPIPPGAVCTCNCVPGTVRMPTYSGGGRSGGGWGGRTICTCNRVCTCVPISDIEAKEAFQGTDPVGILERLATLPIATWNYKGDDPSIRHIGPMAQDFAAAFAVGEDDRHICPVDAQGVSLAAIQGLYRLMREKGALIEDQQRLITELREQLRLQVNDNREREARIERLEREMDCKEPPRALAPGSTPPSIGQSTPPPPRRRLPE